MKIMKLIFLNLRNILGTIALIAFVLASSSCTENETELGPQSESFSGIYMARDTLEVLSLAFIDSIDFNVIRGTTYSLWFYENANSLDMVNFCNHSGTVFDFGTGSASFVPNPITSENCDSASVPRGRFSADFINHGDTAWIYKNSSGTLPDGKAFDSLYILKIY